MSTNALIECAKYQVFEVTIISKVCNDLATSFSIEISSWDKFSSGISHWFEFETDLNLKTDFNLKWIRIWIS